MKNIPENDLFDQLKDRLENYSEEPDDLVWQNIAGRVVPVNVPAGFSVLNFSAGFIVASALAILFFITRGPVVMPERVIEKSIEQKIVSGIKQEETQQATRASNSRSDSNRQSQPLGNDLAPLRLSPRKSVALISKEKDSGVDPADQGIHYSNSGKLSSGVTGNRSTTEKEAVMKGDSALHNPSIADSSSVKQPKPLPAKRKPKPSKPGIRLYALLTPSLSFQSLSPLANDQVTVTKFNSPGILSVKRFGMGLETGIQGLITGNWEYYGGLSYYQQHQTLTYQFQSSDSSTVTGPSGSLNFTIEPGKTYEKQMNNSMKNIGVQGGALLLLKGNKLTTKVGFGLAYQIGLEKSSGSTQNSTSRFLFGQVLYRNELQLTNAIKIFVQPSFSYALTAHESQPVPFKLKPYRAGIGFGLIYQFHTAQYINSGIYQKL